MLNHENQGGITVTEWQEIPPPSGIAVCLFRKSITLRISLPAEKKFTIIGDGGRVVVFGERFDIRQDKPRGGQCEGKEYRLKGRHQGSNFIDPVTNEFDNEGFENVVTGKIENQMILPPNTFLGSTELDPVRIRMTWTNQFGERVGFGTQFPGDLQVFVIYTRFGIPIAPTILSWGRGVVDSGQPIYFTSDFQLTHWERTDGTSLEDDVAECPDEVNFIVRVFDCEDNLVFNGVYPEKPPQVITEDEMGFSPPEYLTIPLNHVMGFNAVFLIDLFTTPPTYTVRLSIFAPLVPPDDIPSLDPIDPGVGSDVPFRDIVSPICTKRWAKIEYICDCAEVCPSGTVCKIQQGNQICCYDSNGRLLDSVDVGCEEPDFIC